MRKSIILAFTFLVIYALADDSGEPIKTEVLNDETANVRQSRSPKASANPDPYYGGYGRWGGGYYRGGYGHGWGGRGWGGHGWGGHGWGLRGWGGHGGYYGGWGRR